MSTATTTTDVDTLNEWVKKIHFENRVDLNLQVPTSGESIKIEVDSIPDNMSNGPIKSRSLSQDPYLSAIVSGAAAATTTTTTTSSKSTSTATNHQGGCSGTPNCTCYKCQRQRRRGGGHATTSLPSKAKTPPPSAATTATTIPSPSITSSQPPQIVSVRQKSTPTDTRKIPTLRKNNSVCLRKVPTAKEYDKRLPLPTYSASDSIYGINLGNGSQNDVMSGHRKDDQPDSQNGDDYKISWKDDSTGDDLLNSLKTFQDIFSAQPEDNRGLSDLIEIKAQELKLQKIKEKQEQSMKNKEHPVFEKPDGTCYTLSTRYGPPHRALTLYHTMKMKNTAQRMAAYDTAFTHCTKSNSGLSNWIQKQSTREPPTVFTSYTPRQRKPTKKSLLQPFISNRKNKGTDDRWAKIVPEAGLKRSPSASSSSMASITLSPVTYSPQLPTPSEETTTPTDVLSAAHALLPNQSPNGLVSRTNTHGAHSYDHVDTPGKPIPHKSYTETKDNVSVSSMDNGEKRTGRLFNSLSKKSLRPRSGTSTSSKSTGDSIKVLSRSNSKKRASKDSLSQKELDDLCDIIPHAERFVLAKYLAEAGGDYMKALELCKQAVAAGKL